MCKTYLTQIKDLRLKLEGCENRTVTRLRQPVDKEPLKACATKTAEQMVPGEPRPAQVLQHVQTFLTVLCLCGRKSSRSWRA